MQIDKIPHKTNSENELDLPFPLDTGFSRECHVQGTQL